MTIRQTTRNTKKVWEADLLPHETPEGKRVRLFAATREKVIAKIEAHRQMTGSAAAFGKLAPAVYAVAARWSAKGRLTAEEIDQACREFTERRALDTTVADAITMYLAAPREAAWSKSHRVPLEMRLAAVRKSMGGRRIADLTAGELEDFYRAQGRSSPNYFSNLRAVFNFAFAREWITSNPFDRLTKPVLEKEDDELLTPERMRSMLAVANVALTRYLILGGFCGLRHSETMRQQLEDIDRSSWEVHVTKMKTQRKGIRERYVQTEPNAQAWLQSLELPVSGPAVPIEERNLRKHRTAACRHNTVGLTGWPDNCLRKSFASYHLAAFENAERTAEILGHTDAETTKAKYRVARKKEVALAWFAILPTV